MKERAMQQPALLALLAAPLVALGVCGCAQVPGRSGGVEPGAAEPGQACAALYAASDRAVERAGVRDGEAARVDGFASLRVDRLLASFAHEPMSDAQFEAWVQRMGELDRAARGYELANLPAAEQARLQREHSALAAERGGLDHALAACGTILAGRDLAAPRARETLRERAVVPDDYDQWKRVVGLYWLTRIPFASGVRDYQSGVEATFATPLEQLPLQGRLTAYVPPPAQALASEEQAAILARAVRNPLAIPDPEPAELERLFDAHAPVWVVDARDDNDRVGALVAGDGATPRVDTTAPVVYRRLAHTRYEQRTLLQLVYSVWLPARPKTSTFDLLSGHLDAVVWRVTLGPDGTPLVYDSIHSCGCYQQFFPTPRAELLPQPATLDETAFVPQRLGSVVPGQRVVLRIASGTHYLQRVSITAAFDEGTPAPFRDDNTLRSLPGSAGEHRSAFRPDGIVPGSERGERYLLWPLGVREPGAMRQWGRHATAFIGRRHFDEARLMQRYFRLRLE